MKNSKRRRKTLDKLQYQSIHRFLREHKDEVLKFAMYNKILEDDGSVTIITTESDGILYDREGYDNREK